MTNKAREILANFSEGYLNIEDGELETAVCNAIITALRGPIPDPETGLVPCGCGKKALFYGFDDDKGDDGLVHKTAVGCPDCPCTTDWEENQDDARKIWNKMMGYKEEE